jgi:hypothetical protein
VIAVDDIDRVFCDRKVSELARELPIQLDVDISRLPESVRTAIRILVAAKSKMTSPDICSEIEWLFQLTMRAAKAQKAADRRARDLARAVENMPIEVREALERNPRKCDIPRPDQILALATRRSAINQLMRLLCAGGQMVDGRERHLAERSWRSRTFQPLLKTPRQFTPQQVANAAQNKAQEPTEQEKQIAAAIKSARADANEAHRDWLRAVELGDLECANAADLRIAAAEGREKRLKSSEKRRRGRSIDLAERDLVQWLAVACAEIGVKVPRTAHYDMPNPFSKFVRSCFELAQLHPGNVTRLINERGRKARAKEAEMSAKLARAAKVPQAPEGML